MPNAEVTSWLVLVNVDVDILASSTEIPIVRLQTGLSLAAERLRRNWSSDFEIAHASILPLRHFCLL